MSEDTDRMKKLVAFKKKIETQVEQLDSELADLKATLETVNSILLEKGFKRAEIAAKSPTTEVQAEPKHVPADVEQPSAREEAEPESMSILKSVTGEVLAKLYSDGDTLHVVMADDKAFNINTPPFNQFLLQRVLLKMQERDNELARTGQLPPEQIICFDISKEDDVIREMVIRNVDQDRLKELKSSIRWTLEKMYDKTKA